MLIVMRVHRSLARVGIHGIHGMHGHDGFCISHLASGESSGSSCLSKVTPVVYIDHFSGLR